MLDFLFQGVLEFLWQCMYINDYINTASKSTAFGQKVFLYSIILLRKDIQTLMLPAVDISSPDEDQAMNTERLTLSPKGQGRVIDICL